MPTMDNGSGFDKAAPRCPYCGFEMTLATSFDKQTGERSFHYFCCNCYSSAPPTDQFRYAMGLITLEQHKEAAYKLAVKRAEMSIAQGEWLTEDYDFKKYEAYTRAATPDETGDLFCSNCRARALLNPHEDMVQSNFCPNCGADMRPRKESGEC